MRHRMNFLIYYCVIEHSLHKPFYHPLSGRHRGSQFYLIFSVHMSSPISISHCISQTIAIVRRTFRINIANYHFSKNLNCKYFCNNINKHCKKICSISIVFNGEFHWPTILYKVFFNVLRVIGQSVQGFFETIYNRGLTRFGHDPQFS